MAYYSSFFNSGLLAPDAEVHRPRTPTTPRAFSVNSGDDKTPLASSFSLPPSADSDAIPSLLAQTEAINISADRPRMRRRRSSMGLSSSPVTPLKGTPPLPRAAAQLQRQSMPLGMASPTRSRSGSVTDSISFARTTMPTTAAAATDATKSNSLIGRLRSVSVGNALRSNSRRTRKPAAVPAPAPPPPTVPLPAPPKLSLPPAAVNLSNVPQSARRPLAKRAQTSDSIPVLLNTPTIPIPISSAMRGHRNGSAASSPIVSSFWSQSDLDTDMEDSDYPVPLDTPGEIRGEYFA